MGPPPGHRSLGVWSFVLGACAGTYVAVLDAVADVDLGQASSAGHRRQRSSNRHDAGLLHGVHGIAQVCVQCRVDPIPPVPPRCATRRAPRKPHACWRDGHGRHAWHGPVRVEAAAVCHEKLGDLDVAVHRRQVERSAPTVRLQVHVLWCLEEIKIRIKSGPFLGWAGEQVGTYETVVENILLDELQLARGRCRKQLRNRCLRRRLQYSTYACTQSTALASASRPRKPDGALTSKAPRGAGAGAGFASPIMTRARRNPPRYHCRRCRLERRPPTRCKRWRATRRVSIKNLKGGTCCVRPCAIND